VSYPQLGALVLGGEVIAGGVPGQDHFLSEITTPNEHLTPTGVEFAKNRPTNARRYFGTFSHVNNVVFSTETCTCTLFIASIGGFCFFFLPSELHRNRIRRPDPSGTGSFDVDCRVAPADDARRGPLSPLITSITSQFLDRVQVGDYYATVPLKNRPSVMTTIHKSRRGHRRTSNCYFSIRFGIFHDRSGTFATVISVCATCTSF
jgi:hypothetical protein